MNIVRDIQSLSEFKQNASKFIKQVQETKEPIVLTVNGKPVAVVQDAESFQEFASYRDRMETAAILRDRIEKVRKGAKLKTADEVFADFTKKYGISFD